MYPHLPGPSWATPYGVMLVLALAAAWMWARRRASSAGMDASYIDLLVPLALIVGSLGLRLFGVLLPEDTLVLGPGQRLPFRRQMFGLLLATLPVVLVYASWMGVSRRALLDVLALPALLWVAVLRIGCFLAGCCWGDLALDSGHPELALAEVERQVHTLPRLDAMAAPFAVRFPATSFAWQQQYAVGVVSAISPASLPVHPTQLYEAGGVLAVLLLLRWVGGSRWRPGLLACGALAGYAALRFGIEFLRADSPLVIGLLNLNQLCSIVLLLLCALGGLAACRRYTLEAVR